LCDTSTQHRKINIHRLTHNLKFKLDHNDINILYVIFLNIIYRDFWFEILLVPKIIYYKITMMYINRYIINKLLKIENKDTCI